MLGRDCRVHATSDGLYSGGGVAHERFVFWIATRILLITNMTHKSIPGIEQFKHMLAMLTLEVALLLMNHVLKRRPGSKKEALSLVTNMLIRITSENLKIMDGDNQQRLTGQLFMLLTTAINESSVSTRSGAFFMAKLTRTGRITNELIVGNDNTVILVVKGTQSCCSARRN